MVDRKRLSEEVKSQPFLQWQGGKRALIGQLSGLLPKDLSEQKEFCYFEPFVGGGAMLFYMLNTFPNIGQVVVGDTNEDLIDAYTCVRDYPTVLISKLADMEKYLERQNSIDYKRAYYYDIRDRYNKRDSNIVTQTAYLLYLTKFGFNSLYRVNTNGMFNVSFNMYKAKTSNTIQAPEVIMACSKALQKVIFYNDDFSEVGNYVGGDEYKFVYLDPPYLTDGAKAPRQYSNVPFTFGEHRRLKAFIDTLHVQNCKVMCSNSDLPEIRELYHNYGFSKVKAVRKTSPKAENKNTQVEELVITNY